MSDVKNMRQSSKKQEIRHLMGELNVLGSQNPQRRKLESEIAGNDWAEQEWKLLQKEKHILQKNINDAQIPAILHRKLLQVPQESKIKRHRVAYRVLGSFVAVLILVFLFVPSKTKITIKDLVCASVDWHMVDTSEIKTSDRNELREYFIANGGIEPAWKKVDERFSLLGGEVHFMSQEPIICSAWETVVGQCILVQFKADSFSLPQQLKKHVWDAKHSQNHLAVGDCLCIVWIKNGFGHIWVIKDSPETRAFFSL
ncbi:hypothetical protein [Candidatus Uabimicrobium sp. HlEnr_7]|uniref:hypothetical protein n=1 Tax=Candidatus Uabimicrobium helgolandensis TaxID=3095367 RepID=UPI003559217B